MMVASERGIAKMHSGDASLLSCLITLGFLQLLPTGNGKADFRVLGPREPLLVRVGEEAQLRCSLSLNISAEGMELRWYRDQPSPAVHVRKGGVDAPEEQMEQYRGRTAFVSDRVAWGQAAVRIRNVTSSDAGTYRCRFKEHTSHSEATLRLKVAGLGSEPRMQVINKEDRAVRVQCTSVGWYPEPTVEWRDLRGRQLSATTNFSVSPTTSLLAVVSSVTLQNRTVEGLSCSISNSLLPEKRVAKILLPAPLSRRPSLSKWRLTLPLACITLGLIAAGLFCIFGKCQRGKPRIHLEEEAKEKEEQRGQAEAKPVHVSLSLDPDTASPKLLLSEDQKSVKRLLFDQDLPPNPKRFDQDPCVLAQEQFWAGRYYWEVEVGDRKAWILGVCLESLSRKGRVPKSPRHGLWAVEFYKKRFKALSYPRISLSPSQPLQRVGIALDCDVGEISFYNVTDGSLVYKFSGLSFSGALQPFFCLWTHDPSPLTICSVVRETQDRMTPALPEVSDLPLGTPMASTEERAASTNSPS